MEKFYNENTNTLVGTRRRHLFDIDEQEDFYVDQINKLVYGTKNFWKCYLMDFLSILGIFDSKQVDVFIYIAENTNQTTNTFLGSYRKIADDTGCSLSTVQRIMKKLQENNFIKKVQNGVWLVNPNILMKGNDKKRQILLSYYECDEPIDKITFARTKKSELQKRSEEPCLPSKEQN